MVRTQYPESTSQTLIDLSLEQLTARSPLGGINRTDDIVWSCPCNVFKIAYALVESHTLRVRSEEQDTIGMSWGTVLGVHTQ